MSKKENSSIWATVEKTARGLIPRQPILPIEAWKLFLSKEATSENPLAILVVAKKPQLEKHGFKPEDYNKTIFNRTSVLQALRQMQKTIPKELFYTTAKHTKLGCGVTIVGLKKWLEDKGFEARSLKEEPKKREPKKKKEEIATKPQVAETTQPEAKKETKGVSLD